MNREQWLDALTDVWRADFEGRGFPLPSKIRVSCSWPSKSALAKKNKRIGEAWSSANSADGHFEVFISPVLQDPISVGAILIHELAHCAVGLACGHKGAFTRCAKALGLEGKMTATVPSEALRLRLADVIGTLGAYPHAELKYSNAPKKQGTRMLKIACPDCGYQVRTTQKWIEVGLPICPCGADMEESAGE